jgi:hypothetical protein
MEMSSFGFIFAAAQLRFERSNLGLTNSSGYHGDPDKEGTIFVHIDSHKSKTDFPFSVPLRFSVLYFDSEK